MTEIKKILNVTGIPKQGKPERCEFNSQSDRSQCVLPANRKWGNLGGVPGDPTGRYFLTRPQRVSNRPKTDLIYESSPQPDESGNKIRIDDVVRAYTVNGERRASLSPPDAGFHKHVTPGFEPGIPLVVTPGRASPGVTVGHAAGHAKIRGAFLL